MTRLEILAGMRPTEEAATRSLYSTLVWHHLDAGMAEEAGALGRGWLPSHHTTDGADLAIAPTAIRTGSRLLTRSVWHFPMFQTSGRRTDRRHARIVSLPLTLLRDVASKRCEKQPSGAADGRVALD
jgi:hypothetical protein